MSRLVLALLASLGLPGLAGCRATSTPAVTPPPPPAAPAATSELSPALAPLAWWLGDWDAGDGDGGEHWVAASGAIYGVSLHSKGFEVLAIDDGDGPGAPDGVLRLYAMPDGARSVEFRQRALGDRAATFANDQHDFPKTITYQTSGDGANLRAVLGGDKQDKQIEFAWQRGTRQRSPELEAADLAFSADSVERGSAAWLAAFDPRGGMIWGGRRVDHGGIAELMQPLLSAGRLAWAPIASGITGEIGFTVGRATFTGARPEDGFRTTYVTVWRRQPDGAWKILFDTGRPVHER